MLGSGFYAGGRSGHDIYTHYGHFPNASSCQAQCLLVSDCKLFVWHKSTKLCEIKSEIGQRKYCNDCLHGLPRGGNINGMENS